MKINKIKSLFGHSALILAALSPIGLTGCGDDVDEGAYYTFTGQTVSSYAKETEGFSIFSSLLTDTGNDALLSSYGHYTVFLPTDKALQSYLSAKGKSYETLTREEKLEIVYNHVIKSGGNDYKSETFEEGSLPETTMSDNYITISFRSDDLGSALVIYINKTTPIVEKDIEVHNGVIHVVGGVIEPSKDFLLDVAKENGAFTIFAEALEATGLNKKTELIYDESYVSPYPDGEVMRGDWKFFVPAVKRYGFTLFAEPDAVMNANGISSLAELTAYAESIYGTEAKGSYTDPENALYKFVAYHLLDRQMNTNEFLYNGPCTMTAFMDKRTEYYETMYTYRLMEIKAGNRINEQSNGKYVGIDTERSGISAVNGYLHGVTDMLVYDEDVMVNDVLNKRIRFDFYNVPPELTNNNIRWQLTSVPEGYSGYVIPNDFCPEHLSFSDETEITMWASDGWTNFEADELKLNGWYDFTLRMLPVPPGSYEIRIGYAQVWWRGIAQLFVDNEIQGIPRDLRIAGTDPMVGWESDELLSPSARAENDKAMRNRGYMKAPASIYTPHNGGTSLRNISTCLRVIIGQFNFQEYGAHYLRGKNVYSPDMEFHGDYIEIIPTSLIDREDIY